MELLFALLAVSVEQLGHPSWRVRDAATRQLASSPVALPWLEAARHHRDPEVRRRAEGAAVQARKHRLSAGIKLIWVCNCPGSPHRHGYELNKVESRYPDYAHEVVETRVVKGPTGLDERHWEAGTILIYRAGKYIGYLPYTYETTVREEVRRLTEGGDEFRPW